MVQFIPRAPDPFQGKVVDAFAELAQAIADARDIRKADYDREFKDIRVKIEKATGDDLQRLRILTGKLSEKEFKRLYGPHRDTVKELLAGDPSQAGPPASTLPVATAPLTTEAQKATSDASRADTEAQLSSLVLEDAKDRVIRDREDREFAKLGAIGSIYQGMEWKNPETGQLERPPLDSVKRLILANPDDRDKNAEFMSQLVIEREEQQLIDTYSQIFQENIPGITSDEAKNRAFEVVIIAKERGIQLQNELGEQNLIAAESINTQLDVAREQERENLRATKLTSLNTEARTRLLDKQLAAIETEMANGQPTSAATLNLLYKVGTEYQTASAAAIAEVMNLKSIKGRKVDKNGKDVLVPHWFLRALGAVVPGVDVSVTAKTKGEEFPIRYFQAIFDPTNPRNFDALGELGIDPPSIEQLGSPEYAEIMLRAIETKYGQRLTELVGQDITVDGKAKAPQPITRNQLAESIRRTQSLIRNMVRMHMMLGLEPYGFTKLDELKGFAQFEGRTAPVEDEVDTDMQNFMGNTATADAILLDITDEDLAAQAESIQQRLDREAEESEFGPEPDFNAPPQ